MSEAVELSEEAYHLTQCSFVRYVIENAEPEIQDDFDRRAFSLFEDWSREARYSQMALGDLLAEMDRVPPSSSFPIEYSQYNYLGPAYLLRPMIERCSAEMARISELAGEIQGSPRGKDLLNAVLARQRYYLDRARKLEAELTSRESSLAEASPSTKPRIKGSSASRW